MVIKVKKDAWFEAGLSLLTEIGPQALTIDGLCQQLDVTKGSFYHHFNNREAYIAQLWAFWEKENVERIITATTENSAENQMDTLLQLIYKIPRERELALRALSLYDTTSRTFQAKIDNDRKRYLEQLAANYFSNIETSRIISIIDYAWYLGIQMMIPPPDDAELKKIIKVYRQIKQAYLKAAGKEK
jgi:AcrR family transcriptional regulator